MGDIDSLAEERSRGFESPGSVHRERNERVIGDVQNPANSIEEGERNMEAPELVAGLLEGSGNASNEVGERESEEVERGNLQVRARDSPPVDDCCPICFDDFTIPCKTNCGHWFCANCILKFWKYSKVLYCCKCPICTCPIRKLSPEASLSLRQEEEIVKVLKNVNEYNLLFVGGTYGLILKARLLPMLIMRVFWALMDPDRFRYNCYMARLVALLLACAYEICNFDFIPKGNMRISKLFEGSAIALVVILFFVGICRRCLLRHRVRIVDIPRA